VNALYDDAMVRTRVAGRVAGCVAVCMAHGASAAPPRWLAHVTIHPGIASVSDELDDGANSPGVALGMQAGAQLRITPMISVGVGLDATFSEHGSDASATADAKYTNYFLPTLVGRLDLGRIAVTSWAGYYLGHRVVEEPGGVFTSTTYSDNDMSGVVLAVAGLVRVRPPIPQPIHFEIGPYVQTGLFSTDDDTSVRSLVIGLVFQAAFNAPPIDAAAVVARD
jgi:hypothetical protein